MTLAILLPTRGRPDNLARFIQTVQATAEDWHLFIRLDTDDPEVTNYDEMIPHDDPYISVYHGDRIRFGPSLNELAAHAEREGYSHLGMFGDDVEPLTLGWDTALVNALGDRLGVAYGDDGLRKHHAPDLPTHYVTQTEVYRRLGYLAPPGIQHLFLDNVARDIGHALGNFVFVPVEIRHRHPWAEGEQINDRTYMEGGRNVGLRNADGRVYSSWTGYRTWRKRLTSPLSAQEQYDVAMEKLHED